MRAGLSLDQSAYALRFSPGGSNMAAMKAWKPTFAIWIALGCLLAAAFSDLAAQVTSKTSVDVTVTDPYGRSVAGLESRQFVVTEGDVQRQITAFTELREQEPKPGVHYKLEFDSARNGAAIQVVLNPQRGLPPLTVTWK